MHKILYHMDPDGYASGAIVATTLIRHDIPEEMIEFHPINYGMELPEIDYDSDLVYMVDFSLQPDSVMKEFCDKLGERLVWIDHHDTAIAVESEYGLQGVRGLRAVTFRDLGQVDDDRKVAGCELTWRYFFEEKIPEFLELIGEWDTWRWKDMEFSHAPLMIFFLKSGDYSPKRNFNWWQTHINLALEFPESAETLLHDDWLPKGSALKDYQKSQDKGLMFSKAFECKFAGLSAIVVNQIGNSEMFQELYDPKKHDLMVGFQLIKGRYWTVSLYSATTDRIHCGELAKKLGNMGPRPSGGGHAGAAGFQTDWDYLWSLITLIEE